jgi:hypothetical protein
MAGVWLFCDRDRVTDRIAVKLSFAHAEGRNYRQLPDRAWLREEPPPADIVCFKRYSVSELCVSGPMSFFWHRSTKPKVTFGLLCGFGISGWKSGCCGYPSDAGGSVVQAIVEGHGGWVDGFVKDLLVGIGDRCAFPSCLESRIFGLSGPPPCRKRKARIAGKVCAYVYGLWPPTNYTRARSMNARAGSVRISFTRTTSPTSSPYSPWTTRPSNGGSITRA